MCPLLTIRYLQTRFRCPVKILRGSRLQVVGRAVQELVQKYNRNAASPTVGIVQLNGLIHSEERVAFREIACQLCA